MKVLATGGCGFLGSHVCEFYAGRGDEVIAFDNLAKHELVRTGYGTEKARSHNWEFLSELGVQMVQGDIRIYEHLLDTAQGCDFIIHTAAQPAMTISIEDVDLDFSTNVVGTLNVLKVARELKIPVVSSSTIHVYGNKINETLEEGVTRYLRTPPEIDEQHSTLEGVLTPLHASKRSGEIYVQTFIDTYDLEAASFRFTGLYGPRQFGGEDHGWVANFCIRAVLGWEIILFSSGKQVRDILFATDAVKAFHAFYENRKPGIYNIGGGYKYSISLVECIDLIGRLLGKKPSVRKEQSRHGDLYYFVCETSRAKQELGWEPTVAPNEGVQALLNWVQQNIECFRG